VTIAPRVAAVIPATSAEVTCSYAGGCKYEVVGSGWYSSLKTAGNGIKVCDKPVTLSTTESDGTKAVFTVPSLATTESIKNFAISKSTYMALTWTGTGTASELAKLSNKNNNDQYIDSDAACKVVTTFKVDNKAILDEVSFFANRFTTKSEKEKLAGKLVF
jgi:hypothetical protein